MTTRRKTAKKAAPKIVPVTPRPKVPKPNFKGIASVNDDENSLLGRLRIRAPSAFQAMGADPKKFSKMSENFSRGIVQFGDMQPMIFSPDECAVLFENSKEHNFRDFSPTHCWNLVSMFLQGDFKVFGKPIILDKDGFVIDGQHRLAAAAIANFHLPTWVFFNPEIRGDDIGLDTAQKNRVLTDWIHHHKVPYAMLAASMLRYQAAYELGRLGDRHFKNKIPGPSTARVFLKITDQLQEFVMEHGSKITKNSDLLSSSISWLMFHLITNGEERAVEFMNTLIDEEILNDSAPVALRQLLLSRLSQARRGRTYSSNTHPTDTVTNDYGRHLSLGAAIKAWNYFILDQPATKQAVTWIENGRRAEPFPEILYTANLEDS